MSKGKHKSKDERYVKRLFIWTLFYIDKYTKIRIEYSSMLLIVHAN